MAHATARFSFLSIIIIYRRWQEVRVKWLYHLSACLFIGLRIFPPVSVGACLYAPICPPMPTILSVTDPPNNINLRFVTLHIMVFVCLSVSIPLFVYISLISIDTAYALFFSNLPVKPQVGFGV